MSIDDARVFCARCCASLKTKTGLADHFPPEAVAQEMVARAAQKQFNSSAEGKRHMRSEAHSTSVINATTGRDFEWH
jgi:hypothetical protein